METPAPERARARVPSLNVVVGTFLVAVCAAVGLQPLHDNSFLTHLATGRLIRADGIPRFDPYTFTVAGDPWVVQSWLASWMYASLEAAWGLNGIRVLTAVLFAAIGALVWRLSSSAPTLVGRTFVAALALGSMMGFLAERPFLFGLVGFGLCALAGEGRLDPWVLVPVGWIWVNSHGSFPLGVVLLALLVCGGLLDRRDVRVEARALLWFTGGLLLGGLNPLGPRLLWFPVELLGRSDVLRDSILEWKPLAPDLGSQGLFALLAIVGAIAVARERSWRSAGVVVVFVAAAFASRRNVPVAAMALVPIVARSLPAVGSVTGWERPRIGKVLLVGSSIALALYAVVALQRSATAFYAYPVASIDQLEVAGLVGPGVDARLVAPDYVGNYLSARYGDDAHSFIDDRYDLFPLDLIDDYGTLVRVDSDPGEVLDRYEADLVLWRLDRPLNDWLDESEEWAVADVTPDERWTIHCRVGSDAESFCAAS